MITRIKTFLIFLISYFLIDFILSYLFLFNLIFLNLEKIYQSDLENRIPNKEYKYTFKSNTSFQSRYNDFIYTIKTNNLGFRDKEIRKLDYDSSYIYLAGDSFLEGVGLDFDETILSFLENENFKERELLNSGVASYSTYIYKKKLNFFLENKPNLKIKRVIILFDKSDPIDDQQYISEPNYFEQEVSTPKYKKNLSERFITLAFLKILGNFLDEKRRDIKYRYLISKKYNKSFFELNQNQIQAFKSIGNRRFISSYYSDNEKWENETKKFLIFSFKQLKEIEEILSKKNIQLDIFLYPWSFELTDKELSNKYINFMNLQNKKNNLNIHNCYDFFQKKDPLEQLNFIGETYLYADVHYNSKGNSLLADCIKTKLEN